MLPLLTAARGTLRFYLTADAVALIQDLPWLDGLEQWDGRRVRMIPVKCGISRHVVRFVDVGGSRYAIKETTPPGARREYENYRNLQSRGIPTLQPVGIVTRDDGTDVVSTIVGSQTERRETGYMVTALMDKVIPDSFLYRRGFSRRNRNRIWDAVIDLFVKLHSEGVYWGDASLANMLINFDTEFVPEIGRRTRLAAVLADAETVEVHPSISDSLRMADVEFFLESMQWTEADLLASNVVRDPMITREDHRYVLARYTEQFDVAREMRWFELVTHIDVDRLLGSFDVRGYGRLLLQHINEHKWYLSERKGREVTVVEAAEDWYRHVFKPVCTVLNDHGLPGFFPDKTAARLYVEIMEHKYFMSQHEKRDVGLMAALEDYTERFATAAPGRSTFSSIANALAAMFGGDEPLPPWLTPL